MLLRKNERSLCQDYQTVFIYSTIACCLGDQCNPSAPPPHPLFPGSPFPFSPPLSDWRLYWLVPLSWPSDGHSSCQEMEINLRQSALKPIDFSWLQNIWKDRPVQPLLHGAYMNNLMLGGSHITPFKVGCVPVGSFILTTHTNSTQIMIIICIFRHITNISGVQL